MNSIMLKLSNLNLAREMKGSDPWMYCETQVSDNEGNYSTYRVDY